MATFLRSEEFDGWLAALKDTVGRARIIHCIRAAEAGAEYLIAALEDQSLDLFLMAVRDVAPRGMARLAKDTGLGRENLYKALTPGAKPRYDTVLESCKES